MANPSTVNLAARIESLLKEKAKYAGLEVIPWSDDKAVEEYHLGECSNSIILGLRGERGRVWTVTVADPDDGEED